MKPKYNINEVVYTLTSELKIRPVLISGVKLTRSSETYIVELENKKGELISLEVDESKLHLRPVDITSNIINEYKKWNENRKKLEENNADQI